MEALSKGDDHGKKQWSPGANSEWKSEKGEMNLTMWSCPGNDQVLTCKGYTNPEMQKVEGDMGKYNEKDIYF